MICPDCNQELPENSRFCKECGRKLDLICIQCGKSIPLNSKFCPDCGQDQRQSKNIPKIDYQQPKSYTPKHLAEKILTSRSAIEGERKVVTIFFADVAGSTAMFEHLDPEAVHETMDGCFRIILDKVHHFEGTVNQFRGDGVMALFGAPIAHEDHAQRACHAALAIQKALVPYREKLKKRYNIEFAMRIGLHSGPVVVASIGDDLRMDYTAQGDTANLAYRMESSADPGGVLVSYQTHRLSRDFFSFEPPRQLQVKGKSEPVAAYQLIEATEVQTRIAASTARGLTRYVGRERELETLRDAFNTVRSGEGQVVGLVGEAGVGKSRLLLEFRRSLTRGEHIYLAGQCLHYGGRMPYLPVLDVIRSFIGVKEGETELIIQEKLRRRITGLDENLLHIIPPFQELLSITVEDEGFAKLDPKKKRKKTFDAIRDLLVRGSQDLPLVLAVEDLHWIDQTTQELLDYMIHWLPRTRILLILLYRPEYIHQWGSKSYYRMIGVNQLPTASSADLVCAILEDGKVAPELRNLILGRTSGNPLFIEEMTHTLLENGSIEKQGDHFVLTKGGDNIQMPDTIQGIIAARMDRLEENLKSIMQVASVIGREFAFRILETISDMNANLKSQLINLQGLEFIYEKTLFPELEYIFRHALVQEVAYNSLLVTRRKEIHEKIGQAIEKLYPERLEEFCEMLGYHYSVSGNLSKAYEYLKRSAKKAVRNNSLSEGVRYYTEAMAALTQMPETDESKREQIDLVLSMRDPMARIGYAEGYLPMLLKAEKLTEEISDAKKNLRIQSTLGAYYIYRGGDPQLGWKYLEKSFSQQDIIEDITLMVPIGFDLCASSLVSGDFKRVSHIAPIMINLIERCRPQAEVYNRLSGAYARILAQLGASTAGCKGMAQGELLLKKALSLARKINNVATTAYIEWVYGITLDLNNDGEKAIQHLERAIKLLEESQTILLQGVAWSWLGYAHTLLGQKDSATDLTEKGLKIHSDLGVPYWRSVCHYCCSHAYFIKGDLEVSRAHAERAVQYSLENHEKGAEGISRAWLGQVLARINLSQLETASEILWQGIRQLEELGILTQAAMGYFWLGEINAEAGYKDTALLHLRKAEAMFQTMGMNHWLEKAKSALAKI